MVTTQQTNSPNKAALDVNLVNAVVGATQAVLGTMASTEATVKSVKAAPDYKPCGDISGIIGMSGDGGEGMFSISLNRKTANLLVGRMIGTEPDHISSSDRSDGVGELVNMIGGQTKTSLSQQHGHVYKLTLPTVIQGSDHEISSRPKNHPYLLITFETEGEEFSLQVSFKQS